MTRIAVLPGDGIGPEVIAAGLRCSPRVADVDVEEHVFGGASIDAHGIALTDEVLAACRARRRRPARRGRRPEVGHDRPAKPRPEQGLLGVRKGLGLFANLRPVRAIPALYDASPLREERIAGTDLLVVRELTGGIYFGAKDAHRDLGERPLHLQRRRRSSGSSASRSAPPAARDERRQGERARDLAALARGRARASTPRSSRTSSSSTCSSTTPRCSSSARRATST